MSREAWGLTALFGRRLTEFLNVYISPDLHEMKGLPPYARGH